MSEGHKPYKTRLSDRDVTILMQLFQLQAIRTKDLVEVHFSGKEYGYQRLQRMCDKRYIDRTYTVRKNGQRFNSVYNITDRGIEELLKIGKITRERRARDLKLNSQEMIVRIEVSKIAIWLEKFGWKVLGSRDAKILLGLSQNSSMECLFQSPEEEQYRVYVLGKTIKDHTLIKLHDELIEKSRNNIVLYRAETAGDETPAYLDIVNLITRGDVSPTGQLCLIPMFEWEDDEGQIQNLAINVLKYGSQNHLEKYLRKTYDRVKYGDNRYLFGNIIVEEGGQEKLVCNYLRKDRTALRLLAENYTTGEYQTHGKGVIVFAWQGDVEQVRQSIDRLQPRNFIEVKGISMQDILESQEPEREELLG